MTPHLIGIASVVVAGTHGKTTTSSMMSFVLAQAGRDPSFLIGGVPMNFRQSWRLGTGAEFVVEGDEDDTAFFDKKSKFLHYRPQVVILTSVEFDHADIFANGAAVTCPPPLAPARDPPCWQARELRHRPQAQTELYDA
jgi:UDP-N-acetylmuramate-alanine ligase